MRKVIIALAALASIAPGRSVADSGSVNWFESMTPSGDLRYRYESIDEEGKDTRNRHRIRARVGLKANANEDLDIGVRIATAQGSDPVSNNQTLGDGFSKKDVYFDLAYLDWHPSDVEGFHLIGGKMENPFLRPGDLVFDNDLTPEGLAIKHAVSMDSLELMFNAGGFLVEERSSKSDTSLYGVQGGLKYTDDSTYGQIAAGYFAYNDIKGFPTIFDSEDGFGNTTVAAVDGFGMPTGELLYANDYKLFNLNGEIGFDAGVPVALYADYVVNNDADADDTGYMFGTRIGKAKEKWDWDFDYNYRDLEKDAVVGIFTDSDSFGGGTDGKGHKFSVGLQLAKNLKSSFTYFVDQIGLSSSKKDYDRFQLDLVGKF